MIKGVRYPLEQNPHGYFASCNDIEQIKSSLLIIILTLQGQRVMEPNFGTPLHTINLLQPIEGIEHQARMMIAYSIKRWEKRVTVTDIEVKAKLIDYKQYDLRIEVNFIEPRNPQRIEKLTVGTTIGAYN